MNDETTRQTAARLGLSLHTIRRWVQEGRIPGAVRPGRAWMIPVDFGLADLRKAGRSGPDKGPCGRTAMPLMCSAYPVGSCREMIESIPDENLRTGWRKVHRLFSRREVAANLTATEFTIAMLYNCGRERSDRQKAATSQICPQDGTDLFSICE